MSEENLCSLSFVSDLYWNSTHLANAPHFLLSQLFLGHSTHEIMDWECSKCSQSTTCEEAVLHLLNMALAEECQILHQRVAEV